MIKGSLLRDAIMSGAVSIANQKREVDELNVYPVPDGDTGTNMSMTMSNALKELQILENNVTVSQVANIAASSLLRGARGNSGVILSLLFRGFSKGLDGKKNAAPDDLARALELGVDAAYKAVMKPTEGTILTVARLAAVKAREIAATTSDTSILWNAVCDEAADALAKTPEMLPVLKKAGVVDAGGKGLLVVFEAMRDVFNGGKILAPQTPNKEIKVVESSNTAVGDFDEEINFTYCTEFIVNKSENCKDALCLRAFLETIGDCVVVVDDDEIIKVHVHSDHPGKAIEEGIKFGMLVNLKIENMREQHEGKVRQAKINKGQNFTPVSPEKTFGFVAVASGKGIEDMFKDLGADCIVRGGQTMNPSTNDIVQAILATPAETVFVLPNNKNIIMAAEQAVKLVSDRRVCVLQSRTIPQGISAMLNFDQEADFSQNRMAMTKALDKVGTGLITFAARDSDYEGRDIKQGEILALENGKLSFTEKDVSKAAYKLIKKLLKSDSAYITLIYGADVSDEKAQELQKILQAKIGERMEVTLINGGQPVYYYIISVE
ncbi:MAG: DAK2 domain-containing protein [Oscillospiraceae bacterium]